MHACVHVGIGVYDECSSRGREKEKEECREEVRLALKPEHFLHSVQLAS